MRYLTRPRWGECQKDFFRFRVKTGGQDGSNRERATMGICQVGYAGRNDEIACVTVLHKRCRQAGLAREPIYGEIGH
jgi:hypothetical protein